MQLVFCPDPISRAPGLTCPPDESILQMLGALAANGSQLPLLQTAPTVVGLGWNVRQPSPAGAAYSQSLTAGYVVHMATSHTQDEVSLWCKSCPRAPKPRPHLSAFSHTLSCFLTPLLLRALPQYMACIWVPGSPSRSLDSKFRDKFWWKDRGERCTWQGRNDQLKSHQEALSQRPIERHWGTDLEDGREEKGKVENSAASLSSGQPHWSK